MGANEVQIQAGVAERQGPLASLGVRDIPLRACLTGRVLWGDRIFKYF